MAGRGRPVSRQPVRTAVAAAPSRGRPAAGSPPAAAHGPGQPVRRPTGRPARV